MRTINIDKMVWRPSQKEVLRFLQVLTFVLIWYTLPKVFVLPQGNSQEIANSIGLMVVLAMLSFMMLLLLCYWLFRQIQLLWALPELSVMILGFKEMDLWDQLKGYFCLFALLVLSAVGVLLAVL